MIRVIPLAWRNFSRHLSRYRVLLTALTLVVAVLLVVLGAVGGMSETLRSKASRYFAGDVAVFGYMNATTSLIEDPDRVDRLLDDAGLDELARSRRSTYYADTEANLFHAGYYTRQRRFIGVEWDRERPALEGFDFAAGGVPASDDREGVLISTAAASSLSAEVGDSIILSSATDQGQANTIELTVRGVYRESTFFGYSTYLDRRTLNNLLGRSEETVNEIGIYLAGGGRNELRAAQRVSAALEQELPTFPIIQDRDGNSRERGRERDERHYGAITLGAQLAEIEDLLEALTLIAGAIIVMFLVLVAIGVSNTYSMIVYERTREIGTLRAMGMSRTRTIVLFLCEALILGAAGVVLGSLLGVGVLEFVERSLSFRAAPGFAELFLVGGTLEWALPPWAWGAIAAMAIAASAAGCLHSAVRAGRIAPVDALRE